MLVCPPLAAWHGDSQAIGRLNAQRSASAPLLVQVPLSALASLTQSSAASSPLPTAAAGHAADEAAVAPPSPPPPLVTPLPPPSRSPPPLTPALVPELPRRKPQLYTCSQPTQLYTYSLPTVPPPPRSPLPPPHGPLALQLAPCQPAEAREYVEGEAGSVAMELGEAVATFRPSHLRPPTAAPPLPGRDGLSGSSAPEVDEWTPIYVDSGELVAPGVGRPTALAPLKLKPRNARWQSQGPRIILRQAQA